MELWCIGGRWYWVIVEWPDWGGVGEVIAQGGESDEG